MEDFVSINVNTGRSRTNSLINRKMIFRILGILLFMEAAMFLVCASVSWYYREKEYIYFIYSILINVGVVVKSGLFAKHDYGAVTCGKPVKTKTRKRKASYRHSGGYGAAKCYSAHDQRELDRHSGEMEEMERDL